MSIPEVVDLLACPLCRESFELTADDRSVCCGNAHTFDLGRSGYLNLRGASEPKNADTPAMVAARDRFLSQGHYRPLADRLTAVAAGHQRQARRLLDCGAGTGYYLAGLLAALPGARGIALDVSVAAARLAARAHPRLGAVVADVWQPMPLASGSFEVILNVFAPRNAREFDRLLSDSGVLVTATPAPEHLQEMREPLRLLQIQRSKQELLQSSLDRFFAEEFRETLTYRCQWGVETLRDCIAMGPQAFHVSDPEIDDLVHRVATPLTVTVAVAVSGWVRRR